ncbi:MAG: SCO family protein [Acidobacteria bacterium]|nr:SCO family protein [Acidobacteriota bacterium]
MTSAARGSAAVAALLLIVLVTASWWALALWPVDATAPEWFVRTREVCFGATRDGLPDAGGWILLIGQPVGMIALLATVWPADLRVGLATVMGGMTGQLATGALAAAIVAGLGGVFVRVAGAGAETFSPGSYRELAAGLTRINDAPPAMSLVDQRGEMVALETFLGRPVLVTFAFAHCETVCPLVVSDVAAAAARLIEEKPVVLILTLDPWRDTPSRLPAMAEAWRLTGDARVLSGEPAVVERALNAWRIPRIRNEKTGDVSHPSLVYVIGRDGRIAYALPGGADAIVAAVKAL